MFKVTVISIITLGVFLNSAMQAATFTIHNDGSNVIEVNPQWSGRCGYDVLNPGSTRDYNSGFNNVGKIKWIEQIPAAGISVVGVKDPIVIKIYEGDANLGWANIGGHFKIYNGGSFRREFGVDGTNDGNATSVSDL